MCDGENSLGSQLATQNNSIKSSFTSVKDAHGLQNPFRRRDHNHPAPEKSPASNNHKKVERKQALFSVLQKVERAIAKRKAVKPGIPSNSGPSGKPLQECKVESVRKASRPESSMTVKELASRAEAEPSRSTSWISCIVLEIFTMNDVPTVHALELGMNEKMIRAMNVATGHEILLKLKGNWYDSNVEVGQSFNIFDYECVDRRTFHITDQKGMLVVCPEVVTTGTRISAATSCIRQAKLDEDISSYGSHPSATYGTLKHEMIQKALTNSNQTRQTCKR